jgi:hypothetical protein
MLIAFQDFLLNDDTSAYFKYIIFGEHKFIASTSDAEIIPDQAPLIEDAENDEDILNQLGNAQNNLFGLQNLIQIGGGNVDGET